MLPHHLSKAYAIGKRSDCIRLLLQSRPLCVTVGRLRGRRLATFWGAVPGGSNRSLSIVRSLGVVIQALFVVIGVTVHVTTRNREHALSFMPKYRWYIAHSSLDI